MSHRARIEKPSSVILLELFCDYVLDRDKQAAKVKLELFEERSVQTGKLFRAVAVEPTWPCVLNWSERVCSSP